MQSFSKKVDKFWRPQSRPRPLNARKSRNSDPCDLIKSVGSEAVHKLVVVNFLTWVDSPIDRATSQEEVWFFYFLLKRQSTPWQVKRTYLVKQNAIPWWLKARNPLCVGILKNHLNQITLLNKCDQTTPKFNYKVLLERWHSLISFMPLD